MQSDCLACLETKLYFVIFYNKSTVCVDDITFEFEFYYDTIESCYSLPSSHLGLAGKEIVLATKNCNSWLWFYPTALLIIPVLIACALVCGYLKYSRNGCRLLRRAITPEIIGYPRHTRQPGSLEMSVFRPTTAPFETDFNLQPNEDENRVPTASSWGSDFDECSFSDTSLWNLKRFISIKIYKSKVNFATILSILEQTWI